MPNLRKILEKGGPVPAVTIGDSGWQPAAVDPVFDPEVVYLAEAIQEVASQPGCVSTGHLPGQMMHLGILKSGWFVVGLDRNYDFLVNRENLVAAPCPDFCSGGIPMVQK